MPAAPEDGNNSNEQKGLMHLSGVISALTQPIAIFDVDQCLIAANAQYYSLWPVPPDVLRSGTKESDFLDYLRRNELLPFEVDYRAWRARHLNSYGLTVPRESLWHLPDGRTIQIVSAPAGPSGGVIYVCEDVTAQLQLKSENKSLLDVQKSTIDALSDAVAVFGLNGRLKLYNKRFATMCGISESILSLLPHINLIVSEIGAIGGASSREWSGIRSRLLDLNPVREDIDGRLELPTGRLADFKVNGMPDGQSLLTLVDVTEREQFSKVLQERNEAVLVAETLQRDLLQRSKEGANDAVAGSVTLGDDQRDFMASLRQAAEQSDGLDEAVSVPDQRPGLAFHVNDEELLDLHPTGIPSETEYKELEVLRPIVVGILEEIIALSAGSNVYPQLSLIARHYKEALGASTVGPMSIDQLYAYGIRLANLLQRIRKSAAAGEIPEQPDGLGEALESLLAIHGTIVLTTRRGRQLLDAARIFAGAVDDDLKYKEYAIALAEKLANSKGVVANQAAAVIVAVNSENGAKPYPDRSIEIAKTTNYNFLAAAGKVVLLGGMGNLVSTSLITSIPGGAAVSIGVELFNACWYFILNNEQLLRGLAVSGGQDLMWVAPLLDFMREGRKDYLRRWANSEKET